MAMRWLPLVFILGFSSTASAVGVGFGYELYQLELGSDAQTQGLKTQFPVRRYLLVDTSGKLFGFVLTMMGAVGRVQIDTTTTNSATHVTETTTYTHDGKVNIVEASVDDDSSGGAVLQALRVTLEYATSADSDADVQFPGRKMEQLGVDFSEVRFTLGATLPHTGWTYLDVNLLDLIWRSLEVDAPGEAPPFVDAFAWQLDAEYGIGRDGLRAGAFVEWDMMGVFNGASGLNYGAVARANVGRVFALEARLKAYEWRQSSNSGEPLTTEGRSATLLATVEF